MFRPGDRPPDDTIYERSPDHVKLGLTIPDHRPDCGRPGLMARPSRLLGNCLGALCDFPDSLCGRAFISVTASGYCCSCRSASRRRRGSIMNFFRFRAMVLLVAFGLWGCYVPMSRADDEPALKLAARARLATIDPQTY